MIVKKLFCIVMGLLYGLSAGVAYALTDEYTHQQELERSQVSPADTAQIQHVKKSGKYTEISWEQLLPASWDPDKIFDKFNFDQFEDGDPRAEKAFISETRYTWISRMEKTPSAENSRLSRLPSTRHIHWRATIYACQVRYFRSSVRTI